MYQSQTTIKIRHRLNNGNKEVRIGPYPVDGYCTATRTVYEFDGCYYHPHDDCAMTKVKDNRLSRERKSRTKLKRQYLSELSYSVVEIQECAYKRDILP